MKGESSLDIWIMQNLWLHKDVDVEAKESIEKDNSSRVILYLNETFCGRFVLIIFHWLFCIEYQKLLPTGGACLEVMFAVE